MHAFWGLLAAPLMVAVGASSVSAQEWHDRRILLINDSSQAVYEFHASNVGRRNFEEDILGRRVLEPGQAVVINLDDQSGYCRFDFLTVMEDGRQIVRGGVNACEIESYQITD